MKNVKNLFKGMLAVGIIYGFVYLSLVASGAQY